MAGTEGQHGFFLGGDSQSGSPTRTELSKEGMLSQRSVAVKTASGWGGLGAGKPRTSAEARILAESPGRHWRGSGSRGRTAVACVCSWTSMVTLELHLLGVMVFRGGQSCALECALTSALWCVDWVLGGLLGDTGGVGLRSLCRKQLHNLFRQSGLGAPLSLPSPCSP